MTGFSFHLINVWTDPEVGAGGFNPMASSMLWLPEAHQPGHPTPAFVYVHRWGGYPYDPLPEQLGPALAQQGYGFLSLSLRRRGGEGQLTALPDNDLRDIKLALDYLHTNGFSKVLLIGEELGCISVLSYSSQHSDSRVAGIALLNPVDAPADWLRSTAGDELYFAQLQQAGIAARQGAGMDVRVDFPGQDGGPTKSGPIIAQKALSFLGWWGPMAGFNLAAMLEDTTVPLHCLAGSELTLSSAYQNAEANGKLVTQSVDMHNTANLAGALQAFATKQGAVVKPQPPMEMVRINSAEQSLFGLLWTPADGVQVKTATLLMHGLTSSPLSLLFNKMAPVLAQTGTAVLAVESRRSGWAGHESSVLDNDLEDIDAWVSYLLACGYEKIVLAGASIGSISVGRYQSVKQHPNVVAVAHLMPTADCPDWFRRAAGDGPYQQAVEQAQQAIAAGRGTTELIDIDVRQPAPSQSGGRFQWTQWAASWLSWWGPDADSVNSIHIANAHVPLLLLSGTDDSYNDEARFAELKAAAVNAPSVTEIWYPGIDHGLAGVEAQVAADLFVWMQKVGVVD
jgi:alpha-beta hydrolase superfamily lysophospholipase